MVSLQNLQPHVDTSLATKTADGVLHRVFHEIRTLSNQTEYSDVWLDNVLNILRFSQDIEIGFGHSKVTTLAIVKNRWEKLPHSFRKQYNFAFINFAKVWTSKAKSTIDAYTLTAKVWILDEFGKNKVVIITDRADDGKPIIEDGKIKRKQVEFCPYTIDLSKLSILNPRALKNDMTDELWEMVVDDFYTCDDIRKEHHKDKKDGNGPQYVLRYNLDGPGLFASQNGDSVCVAEALNWEEYESDPVVQSAINHFLEVLGVKTDEDKIFEMIRNAYKK
jgi:hypothetical protein